MPGWSSLREFLEAERARREAKKDQRSLTGVWMFAVVVVAAIVITAVLHKNSGTPDMPATFGPGNTCYYVADPGEVASLKQHGNCLKGSVAAKAPQRWVVSYYPFYNSSWYRTAIVPKADQSSYGTYMDAFGTSHSIEIAEEAPEAKYRDSNGKIVTGSDAGVSSDGHGISDGGGAGHGGGGDGGGGHGGGGE